MNVLVCGGAGYIGSHMAQLLSSEGLEPVIFDNLSTGHIDAVQWGRFVQGDLLNLNDLENLFDQYSFDAVMHFSAKSLVGESITNPEIYYRNNVQGTLNLLSMMRKHSVCKFIFSSTAAVYGMPTSDTIDEYHPKNPINPYGSSKLMVEQVLSDYSSAYSIDSVCLRYFNAAGSDPGGTIGESHEPETHLIPNVLKVVSGDGPTLKVFGDDYDTEDGTCIRDYVHVCDLVEAHMRALEYISENKGKFAFNLGNGRGFSVKQVIESCQVVTDREAPFEVVDRREGDPARLVADSSLAAAELGWKPKYRDIDEIIETAWIWHQNPRY